MTDPVEPRAAKVPVIVAWSPYGKSEGTAPSVAGIFGLVGLDNGIFSGLEKWEGPDPAYWCAHGYAVCNPDARGIADSGGDSVVWDRQAGRDCYDLIEWLAVQDWCTGKVAMSGTSYLAVSQWFTAAEQPPHLTTINPWEGVSDVYRDLVMRGGMPDLGFAEMLLEKSVLKNQREDLVAEAQRYPLMNDVWEDKIPQLDKITVPAYVVSSYSHTLHTQGTFRAWRQIASEEKWLRIHNSLEWPTTTTTRTPRICADSSTTTSRTRQTAGMRPRGSATRCLTSRAATARTSPPANSPQKASPTRTTTSPGAPEA